MQDTRLEALYSRRTFGIKPGLDNTRALLEALGNPQEGLRVIHVAGTNGKGSVSVLTANLIQALGIKTGLFTSPHLVRINERFRIDGRDISDEALERYLGEVNAACKELEARGIAPTFFECTLAIALLWWRSEGVRLAVVEVGMGGRLDATNVLTPTICAITRIGMDHTQFLGDTLSKIAMEKAGIIKPGVPVVIGEMPDEAAQAIASRAREVKAPLHRAADLCSVVPSNTDFGGTSFRLDIPGSISGSFHTRLTGDFQQENIATAAAVFSLLEQCFSVEFPKEVWKNGFKGAFWPGRFQCIGEEPLTILDGGHNESAAKALVKALKKAGHSKGVRFVVGQCGDKDPASFLRIISSVGYKIWTVPLDNPRGLPSDTLANFSRGAGFSDVFACNSIKEGISLAREDALKASLPVVVCGSLFLVGEVLALKTSQSQSPSELL